MTANQTYNLNISVINSCGDIGEPAEYIIDIGGKDIVRDTMYFVVVLLHDLLYIYCAPGFISENLTRGANRTYEKSWGGGNMKTRVTVYEEGLFDLGGGGGQNFCKWEQMPPLKSHPPLKETLCTYEWHRDNLN